jgi:recombination protein RecT
MLYMTVDDIMAHAKRYSQTFSSSKDWVRESSKWTTDFDAMAKKTVLKLLLNRYAPLSVEMRSAVVSDQAVLNAEGQPEEYIDNPEPEEQPQVSVAESVEEKKAEMKEAAAGGRKPDELP